MTSSLAQIVHLGTVGCYAVIVGGKLLEIAGRLHWWSLEHLKADAERAGIACSPGVIDTTNQRRPVTAPPPAARAA